MKKIGVCPRCNTNNPPLTLNLVNPEKYIDADSIPDSRIYELVCLECNQVIDSFEIDNTISTVKELKDEMDRLYGKSIVIPTWLFVKEKPNE